MSQGVGRDLWRSIVLCKWWECKSVQQYLSVLNMHTAFDLVVPFLRIYTINMFTYMLCDEL